MKLYGRKIYARLKKVYLDPNRDKVGLDSSSAVRYNTD